MKQQIANRLGVAHIRDTVRQLVEGKITRFQAMESLRIKQSRLYELRTSYLAAMAKGVADGWTPGTSGGNHMPEWSEQAQRFLAKVLKPDGDAKRYSYAFAASEVGRQHGLMVDRAQVRHWAMEHGMVADVPKPRAPAHVRRRQRKVIGELWQLDATPDYFLGRDNPMLSFIDMTDDCSRMQVGCRLYRSENVPAYLDLFYRAFTRYGLPLEIYRELHDTSESVCEAKIKGGQCKLRQPPRNGWWELVLAEWKGAVIGPRGRLLVDGVLCPTECANGTRVWICRHIDGTLSLVLNKPEKGTSPKVVFTNNPMVNRG